MAEQQQEVKTPTFTEVEPRHLQGDAGIILPLTGNLFAERMAAFDFAAEIVVIESAFPETQVFEHIESAAGVYDTVSRNYRLAPLTRVVLSETYGRSMVRPAFSESLSLQYEQGTVLADTVTPMVTLEHLEIAGISDLIRINQRRGYVSTCSFTELLVHDADAHVNDTIFEDASVVEESGEIIYDYELTDVLLTQIETATVSDSTLCDFSIVIESEIEIDDDATGDLAASNGWSENRAEYLGSYAPEPSGLAFKAALGDIRGATVAVRNGGEILQITRVRTIRPMFNEEGYLYVLASPIALPIGENVRCNIYGTPIQEEAVAIVTPPISDVVEDSGVLDDLREEGLR